MTDSQILKAQTIEAILAQFPEAKREGLLLWAAAHSSAQNTEAAFLEALLAQTSVSNDAGGHAAHALEKLEAVSLEDLVGFTILQEFGPGFAQRPEYPKLVAQVVQKLSQKCS